MRAHTTILAFLTVALPGCSEDAFDVNDFQDDPAITTLNGTWRVISFEDFTKQKVEFKTHENSWDKDIVVTFDDTTDPAWFSGRILTNLVFGEFDYLNKRQFKLRRLGTTEVNEPAWGDKFRQAVCWQNAIFKISSAHLRIYFDNGRQSVTLIKQ